MKRRNILILIVSLNVMLPARGVLPLGIIESSQISKKAGSYYSGIYQNLFADLLAKSEQQAKAKVDAAFNQLFYGDNNTQRVYYPVGNDMGYIKDIYNNDVRTEGMSYGMMIAVQLNKKMEFDRLWKWTKTFMQHRSGASKNYFAWHCETNGSIIDSNSASDGEEWFVMALFFASARWGTGDGIYNYSAEAQTILNAMLNKEAEPENDGKITNVFNKKEKQVVFVPSAEANGFTDPSYHLPHYYELWARWSDNDNRFWCDAVYASRQFLKRAVHPSTGLAPNYARFDGSPIDPWGGGNNDFRYDAWRVAMNVAVDYSWFGRDTWAIDQSNRLLNFFHAHGVGKYGNLYALDGKQLSENHSVGLVAMNAVACLASTNDNRKDFVDELWNADIPSGPGRYYDGMLYMLAMLHVSGNFRVHDPTGHPVPACSND